MTLEVDIEDKVVLWAKKKRFLTPKVKFIENGYPDRLFISPYGHTIFIEFKKPGETPEPIQEYRLNELRKRGIPATWCDSVHEAIGILNTALETVLGPSPIPEESDQASLVAGVGRALLRSGPGENVNSAGDVQNTEGERLSEQNANNRATQARPEDVAGRDKEVVRILRPSAYHPTWGRERPKS